MIGKFWIGHSGYNELDFISERIKFCALASQPGDEASFLPLLKEREEEVGIYNF